ncbi:MAG: hydroxymethylglutaryl-CoA synthase family protein [Candidatus Hermodarchaeota archaeon]
MKDSVDNDFFFNVGIDSMGFYTSKYYVDLAELAKFRDIDPNKFLKGLLTKEMRIPSSGEDIVSMAVKAGQHALLKGNIDPSEIDAVFVGTETMTYAVKSVSNILTEVLGTSLNCVTQDVYNACAGETLAILNAIGLINNGIINKALIIGADICSYELKSPGEPTQGAAAAAVVISKSPRIAAFGKNFGKFSANITDFYRMPYEKYPVVFGKYSIDSYIKFQLGAFDDFFQNAGNYLPDYMVFHSPFAKLPLKNLQNLLLNRWDTMKKIFLDKPVRNSDFLVIPEEASDYLKELLIPVLDKVKREENVSNTDELEKKLIKNLTCKVLPTLNVPMSIGNMYSASTWAQLIYLLETVTKKDDIIYFGSYGSGATCISGMLKVMPGFKKIVEKVPTVNDFIQNKERKSVSEYEAQRKGIDADEIFYAKIEPIESNENIIIEMTVCDEGCIISKLDGFNYCPGGSTASYKKNYPMYAIVKSDPVEVIDQKDILTQSIVRVTSDVKKGQIVEYNLLRAGKVETKNCALNGFINWKPTYKPISHPLE